MDRVFPRAPTSPRAFLGDSSVNSSGRGEAPSSLLASASRTSPFGIPWNRHGLFLKVHSLFMSGHLLASYTWARPSPFDWTMDKFCNDSNHVLGSVLIYLQLVIHCLLHSLFRYESLYCWLLTVRNKLLSILFYELCSDWISFPIFKSRNGIEWKFNVTLTIRIVYLQRNTLETATMWGGNFLVCILWDHNLIAQPKK